MYIVHSTKYSPPPAFHFHYNQNIHSILYSTRYITVLSRAINVYLCSNVIFRRYLTVPNIDVLAVLSSDMYIVQYCSCIAHLPNILKLLYHLLPGKT